jgi:c-di-GMP-binding flagellar brake protein YcgR
MTLIKRLLTLRIRKYRRHQAKDGAYVTYGRALARHQINDLSMGGLSFYYVDKGSSVGLGFRKISLINRNRICLEEVPFKTVSDVETGEIMFQNKNKKVKRKSVRFDRLTRRQKRQLKAFISSFTD